MVKIEEKSAEEKAKEEKCKTLADITREMFRENPLYSVRDSTPYFINVITRGERLSDINVVIHVNVMRNRISVDEHEYFQDALRLAEMYESKTGQEFTLKKKY